jgi:26S proteasome regulatory subunit N3
MADVLMADAPSVAATESQPPLLNDLLSALALVDLSVTHKDARHTSRALRLCAPLRRKLTPDVMDAAARRMTAKNGSLSLECTLFLGYLRILTRMDAHDASTAASSAMALLQQAMDANRRSADLLASKLLFTLALAQEKKDGHSRALRPFLFTVLRTSSLRHDDHTLSVALTALLRSFVLDRRFEAADKLAAKQPFPRARMGSASYARYLYYVGYIKAVQLDYSTSLNALQSALRRAPESSGFAMHVTRLLVLVTLLMGDVPEKRLFRPFLRRSDTQRYVDLVRTVRSGDVSAFTTVVETHTAAFAKDGLATMVVRLRHNVIKVGLRGVAAAYGRIGFSDIGKRVGLGQGEDVEGIVAKAIRDGVVDAECVHQNQKAAGFMKSKDVLDVYSTTEPQTALHKRIVFCLEVHNEAVRAMRFPDDAHAKSLMDAAEISRKLQQEEEEIANAMEDDEDF